MLKNDVNRTDKFFNSAAFCAEHEILEIWDISRPLENKIS